MSKDVFREHFRDYVEQERGRGRFDTLNEMVRSREMARFFADKILHLTSPDLIPVTDEELDACSFDGSKDCGVDFISRQGNRVLIIQSKYAGGKKPGKKKYEAPEAFEYFRQVLARLHSHEKYVMNERLREAVSEIEWGTDSFFLFYVTLSKPAENAVISAKTGVDEIEGIADLSQRVTLELLDEEKLNVCLRDALEFQKGVTKPVSILFTENDPQPPWMKLEDLYYDRATFIGRVSGIQLAKLFESHKSGLFSLNIRNYIGNTKTNKEIKNTALEEAEDFFYFNNGISALATRVRSDSKDPRTLVCESFSIINGSQTIRSLHKAYSEQKEPLEDVQVLVRIIEYVPKAKESTQKFLDNITRFNNTQNAIKISDFRSNDAVQVSLRTRFYQVPALRGKKFIYLNKRSGDVNKKDNVIPMEEFAKSVHSFLLGPDDAFGGTDYLFDSQKGYAVIYGDEIEQQAGITYERFERLAGIWFLCAYVKDQWRRRGTGDKDHKALERRWMVYYAVGQFLREMYEQAGSSEAELSSDLRGLSEPSWLVEDDARSTKRRNVVNKAIRIGFETLKRVYDSSARDISKFKHRNWFRSPNTLADIGKELRSSATLLKDYWQDHTFRPKKST